MRSSSSSSCSRTATALVGAATSSVRARFVLGSSVAIVLDESSWVSAMPNACVSESDDANPDRQVGIRSAKGLLGVFGLGRAGRFETTHVITASPSTRS